jgi:regulator of sigma E protease
MIDWFINNILVFIFALGVLVFFHEMGHFIAAKLCGIYCDQFSLGMPPRIWGKRIGETDYCIGALPIGGFVKMAGQEDAPRSEEEQMKDYADVPPERWFSNKPVWQRSIVIIAGPLMNVVLAALLYGFVAAWGREVPESRVDSIIGRVSEDAPASSAPLYALSDDQVTTSTDGEPDAIGWATGDRILQVNDRDVRNLSDVLIESLLEGEQATQVVLERPQDDGSYQRYLSVATPAIIDGEEPPRFGIAPFSTAVIREVLDDHPASRSGLQPDDVIRKANGQIVDSGSFAELAQATMDGGSLDLEVERDGERLNLTVHPIAQGRLDNIILTPQPYGLEGEDAERAESMPITVAAISKQRSEELNLKRKDIVTAIDGKPATLALLRDVQRTRAGEPLKFSVTRPPIWFGLLRGESQHEVEVAFDPVGTVGVVWGSRTITERVALSAVPAEGVRRSVHALGLTLRTIGALFSGNVGADDLGGPLMIQQITASFARLGFTHLIEIMAFISINLAVFNLLPLPVLDGGQMVFLFIEAIRRKPIDMRILERVQQFGMIFILCLILFVTFNDIKRIMSDIIP